MSFLAPASPASKSQRMVASQPVSSNILGTPWPSLWGLRDLSGTVVAWTNHRVVSGGATGKGGGQVASGSKHYRTFALGLCIGPVDRITQIWYDNKLIWSGNISIAQATTVADVSTGVGSVILSTSDVTGPRGTVTLYFGLDGQTQDPMLAQFIPDAPFYRGMCYAVFHGPRPGTTGFRIGNADTLCQVALRIEREPSSPPGTPFTAQVGNSPANGTALAQAIAVATDTTAFTGTNRVFYALTATAGADNTRLNIGVAVIDGVDTGGSQVIQSGTPFAVGTLGLMVTLTWNAANPPLNPGGIAGWSILLSSAASNVGGANVAGIVYEILTSDVHGINLNPALINPASFVSAINSTNYVGLAYASTQKQDMRTFVTEVLKNIQGALVISNGKMILRILGNGSDTIQLTLESDDIKGVRQRPGAWYELPQHVTVKYRDATRKFHDTVVSMPGAGDFGDDEAAVEIDLQMITDAGVAKLVGSRLRTLMALPKTPDTITCRRAAFPIQFGDVIAINDPDRGYAALTPLIVLAVREKPKGDESVEIDIAPSLFGSLPIDRTAVGGGGGGGGGGTMPFNEIVTQGAWELPYEFATDGSKRVTVFAARADPDSQGFSLWASSENPPVDYNDVDDDALYSVGGRISDATWPRYTMDRSAFIDFVAASQDIDSLLSLSDTDWFGYRMLILVGTGNAASLYAAKELQFFGGNNWRVQGLLGPLSDTLPYNAVANNNIWIFPLTPAYNLLALPSWVLNTLLTFKGIPFGSRLSPDLSSAIAESEVVINRAVRPRAAVNLNANGRGAALGPVYSTDINLGWDLCNRGSGFGTETSPSEFDPSQPCEVSTCNIEFRVGVTLIRTATANIRAKVTTSTIGVTSNQVFTVGSVAGIQPGDRISVGDNSGSEYFGRVASIAGLVITLVSPLSPNFVVVNDMLVTRYESIGYVYPQATLQADNGGTLPAAVDVRVYPVLGGLQALNPAEMTVTKV